MLSLSLLVELSAWIWAAETAFLVAGAGSVMFKSGYPRNRVSDLGVVRCKDEAVDVQDDDHDDDGGGTVVVLMMWLVIFVWKN